MPDVSRSDSQRSDSSRPRVSFNRDVHIKRIGTPGAPRVIGALAGDGEGHLVPLPVRRERPIRLSRRELAKEAERVLAQADSVACTSQSLLDQSQKGNKNAVNSNRKFSTLPPLRRKNKKNHHNKTIYSLGEESPSSSLERNKQSKKKYHNTEVQSVSKESPNSSLDRKSAKRSGGKNIVTSVSSSRDHSVPKRNKHAQIDQDTSILKNSKKNSSSLNDLLEHSLSSEKTKKQKIGLKRSVSDAGSRKSVKNNFKNKKLGGFLSLDRLTAKRNKKNKTLVVHSDHSDRSPPRPRKNILKKSHSDSESTSQLTVQEQNHHQHSEGRKKKQLSPIIEVLPREDYFHEKKHSQSLEDSEKTNVGEREDTMLHSSQLPTQKPTLTRGQTVDAMVKRLSQEFTRSRGPPRVVNSAPGLITPEHRQHNNNLPFSYTKPTTHQYGSGAPTVEPTHDSPLNSGPAAATRVPTAVDGQVIYAEVVVSGGGSNGGAVSKQTVHTKVLPITQLQPEEPIHPKVHTRQLEETHFQQTSKVFPSESSPPFHQQHKVTVKVTERNQHGSDEDEGLGLTMEHGGYRQNSMDYMDEGKGYARKGVMDSYSGGNSYTSKGGFVEKRTRNGEEERSSIQNSSRREIRTDIGGNNIRKEYVVHESRYESENYGIDPSVRGRADGMDSRKKDFIISENYNGGRYDDGFYHHRNGEVRDNVSPNVRRNLLDDYTRNERKKSEFLSDARIIPPDEIDGRVHYGRDTTDRRDFLSRSIDSNDLSSRRDRLESRIESQRKDRFISNKYSDKGGYKTDPLDTRNEINRKYATDVTYNNRRDFLNSQLDYDRNPTMQEEIRYESDKNYGLKNSRYFESSTTTTEVDSHGKKDLFADSGIEVDYRTKDSSTSRKYDKPSIHDTKVSVNNHHTQNVTRVDLRNHSHDRISDEDDVEINENNLHHNSSNHHSDVSEHHKMKATNTFTSTRLVQEQKHTEAIPSSTVLIRHWVPSNKEESISSKTKHMQSSKSKPEKPHQPLLSDEEYEEYEKSRRKDEYRKEPQEEYKKVEEKAKSSDEKGRKNGEKKVTKKKQSSAMDKMRQLFTRSDNKSGKKNKKKDEKVKVIVEEDEEDPLTSRYTEYRGSDIDLRQESPRPPYRERNQKGSNTELEQQETPRPPHKNRRLEPGSPRDRRHLQESNMELDQDASYHPQKGYGSPKSSQRSRNHHTKASNTDLDEGTPRPSHRDVNRGGQQHRIPSDIEEHKELKSDEFHRPIRQRLATPSSSPSPPRAHNKSTSATLTRINNMKNKEQNSNGSGGGWFKSLDRLTKRGKNKAKEHDKDTDITTEDESKTVKQNNNNNSSSNNKNLRFFGDTDQESVTTSILRQPNHPTLRRYKSNNNNSTNGTSTGGSNNRLQVPSRNSGGGGLRHHRSAGDVATSSAESTTEGDSSQQSQRSVVYLHAATVGDIPGPPRSQRSGVARRAQSREELSSTGGSSRPLQPQTRTVSRSISVLAPWKPRHYKEGLEVHYDNDNSGSKTLGRNNNGKPPKVPVSHHSSGNSTMNRSSGGHRYKSNGDRGKENHANLQKQRVNKAMSIESLSRKNGTGQGQYNRDRTPTEKKRSALNSSTSVESLNQKQNRDRSVNSKKHSALNSSAMELNSNKSYRTATKKGNDGSAKKSSTKVSRSASMPKDSRLTAGWFKLRNKKQGT